MVSEKKQREKSIGTERASARATCREELPLDVFAVERQGKRGTAAAAGRVSDGGFAAGAAS